MADDPLTEDLVAGIEGWLISEKKTQKKKTEKIYYSMCNNYFTMASILNIKYNNW